MGTRKPNCWLRTLCNGTTSTRTLIGLRSAVLPTSDTGNLSFLNHNSNMTFRSDHGVKSNVTCSTSMQLSGSSSQIIIIIIIVRKLPESAHSRKIIVTLGQMFSKFGIPDTFMSDNGPHFSSVEFRSFAGKWNFNHITSSPTYPKSNGLIECQVKAVKSILHKSKSAGSDFHLALLAWRSTPVSYNLASPAQLPMGRKVKSLVPTQPESPTRRAPTR